MTLAGNAMLRSESQDDHRALNRFDEARQSAGRIVGDTQDVRA